MAVLPVMATIPALLPDALARRRMQEPVVSGQVLVVSHFPPGSFFRTKAIPVGSPPRTQVLRQGGLSGGRHGDAIGQDFFERDRANAEIAPGSARPGPRRARPRSVRSRRRGRFRPRGRPRRPGCRGHPGGPRRPGRFPLPERCVLGMAHGHPDVVPRGGQALHDPVAEEPRSPEYGYRPGPHRPHRYSVTFRQRNSTGRVRRSRSARPVLATASSASVPRISETARWGGFPPASTTARARAE